MEDPILVRAQRLKFLNTLAIPELLWDKLCVCVCVYTNQLIFFSLASDMRIPGVNRRVPVAGAAGSATW